MKNHSDSVGQPPRRGDPQIPVNGANQLVAKFSRLYAEADPEDQFALRVWMRDIILSRKEGSVNMLHARRSEKWMIEACERRILEFPVGMDAREVAKRILSITRPTRVAAGCDRFTGASVVVQSPHPGPQQSAPVQSRVSRSTPLRSQQSMPRFAL